MPLGRLLDPIGRRRTGRRDDRHGTRSAQGARMLEGPVTGSGTRTDAGGADDGSSTRTAREADRVEGPVTAAGAHRAGAGGLVVAIDGPAGAGKSTVARAVAARAGLHYLDTGATYRAVTVALLRRGVDVGDPDAVARAAAGVDLTLEVDPGAPGVLHVLLDGVPLTGELRTPEVNAAVSAVSAVPAVRAQLVGLQRAVIGRAVIGRGGIVAEGRDVGAVVWPQAEVKVFLTAAPDERARRRAGGAGHGETPEAVARRDRLDSGRATSPTRAADDAVVIDSTGRPVAGIVAQVLDLIHAAQARRSP